jgi:hypothetical protein
MNMSLDLTKHSAYIDKTPYEVWQETEGVPMYQGLAIDNLATVAVGRGNVKELPAVLLICSASLEFSGPCNAGPETRDAKLSIELIKQCQEVKG